MKMFKRIFTSIVRRPYQMLFVFLTVFILGNVLFASIAVQQASQQVKQEMRNRINGEISLTYNTDMHRVNDNVILRMQSFVSEFESSEHDFDYHVWKRINVFYQPIISNDNFWDMHYGLSYIYGTSNIDDLINGFTIAKGRNYTQDDFDSNTFKIVLPYHIDGYDIGDTIQFNYGIFDENNGKLIFNIKIVDFEIIGVASGYKHPTDSKFIVEYPIVPLTYIEKIVADNEKDYLNFSDECKSQIENYRNRYNSLKNDGILVVDLVRLDIYTEGVDRIDEIKEEIMNDSNFAKAYYAVKSTLSDYLYIQGPLENLGALANVTLWASVILVICILSLISVLFIRSRKYEIGLLMSLGETKFKVILQFVLEILLVGLLATSFAMVSGNKVGDVISTEFMKMQIDTEAELQYQQENGDVITQLDMLEAYEITMDAEYIITIYVSSTIVLLISSLLPMVMIIRMKPKNILLG